MKRIYLLLVWAILLCGCSKNDLYYYDADRSALNIWLGTASVAADSVTYNFAYTVTERDSVMFRYRLSGYPADYDRHFELEATEGDGNLVYYSFGDYVVRAGQYEGTFPIYIDKPEGYAEFRGSPGYMVFRLKENTEFEQGANERSSLRIAFRNYVAKPDNWDSDIYPNMPLANYFGTYSDVKYGFIIQVTGLSNFRVRYTVSQDPNLADNEITAIHAVYLRDKCRAALLEYNATHDEPLLDENRQAVVF